MSSSNESNSKDAVLGASFTDVGVGPDAIHTVRVGGDAYTKLKSIKGVLIEDISIHTLRKWCTQHGFDGTRTLGKKAICDKIVAEKLRLDPSLVLLHFFSGDEPAVDGSKQESWVTDTLTKNQKAIEAVLSGYSIELRNQFKSLCDTACKELGIRDAGMTVLATRCAARSRNSETPSSNSSNPAHYAKWLIKLGEFFTLHESKWIADHGNKNRGPWRPVRDLYDAVSDAKLSIKSSEIFLSNFDYVYKDGTKGTDPPQNPIATGTFGRVYKVMEKGTGKLFAGKIFYPQKRGRFDVQKREVDIMKMMSKNPVCYHKCWHDILTLMILTIFLSSDSSSDLSRFIPAPLQCISRMWQLTGLMAALSKITGTERILTLSSEWIRYLTFCVSLQSALSACGLPRSRTETLSQTIFCSLVAVLQAHCLWTLARLMQGLF